MGVEVLTFRFFACLLRACLLVRSLVLLDCLEILPGKQEGYWKFRCSLYIIFGGWMINVRIFVCHLLLVAPFTAWLVFVPTLPICAETSNDTDRRVAELRESLVEEGRRRQLMYEERRWAAASELRRVRAEEAAVKEKEGMLRLWLQVLEALSVSKCVLFCQFPFPGLVGKVEVFR